MMTEGPQVPTNQQIEEMYGPWEAYHPDHVVGIMSAFRHPWWIAGGWAIEFHLGGSPRRDHEDVDVLILRQDAAAAQRDLSGWDLHLANHRKGVRAWDPRTALPDDVGDIWVRELDGGPWRFQLMLNPSEGSDWVFKRDPTIRLPVDQIGLHTDRGIPYLRPEIQLLNKATGSLGIRDKDEADFRAVQPVLDAKARTWLRESLGRLRADHPWLDAL